jgi:type IV pilus assembly protein PilW
MKKEKGFTLVELMVTVFVAGIVMAGVYSAYYSQQKSYTAQEQMAEMQQNLRAAMYFMAKEIRMAGCNPTGMADEAGFRSIASDSVHFTMDVRGHDLGEPSDQDTNDENEDITYSLADWDGDGDSDLVRDAQDGNGNQPVAENIDVLEFIYLDAGGSVTATADDVASVQVTLVARTGRRDPGYTNKEVYRNLQGTILPTPNDNFRRKALSTHIKVRNSGLL